VIYPDWPASPRVHAVSTTRRGGVSSGPYTAFNLADHVGDDPEAVRNNRSALRQSLGLTDEPAWLSQVHGNRVVDAATIHMPVKADASFSGRAATVCAVLTADCLPVLFCDRQATRVAAAHAGWRGLAAGVLENAVRALGIPPSELMAWLGPAIGSQAFEVGDEVYRAFIEQHQQAVDAFTVRSNGHWLADLYQLARIRLQVVGVTAIYGGDFCTYTERERFYSYRRDGITGRMASLIWLS
jgi:YfiH family protein